MQDDAILEEAPTISATRDDRDDHLPETSARMPSTAEHLDAVHSQGRAAGSSTPTEPLPPHQQPTAEARVVAHLQERSKLTLGDLARAHRLADEAGDPLLPMLVRLGLISERDMAQAMSEVLDLPLADAGSFPSEPVREDLFSLRFLKDAKVLPLSEDDDALQVAFAHPIDSYAVSAMQMAARKPVEARVAMPSEIELALERLYEKVEEAPETADESLGEFDEEDIEHLKDLASEAPVIRMVNQLIQRALESRASDIHIEPFADQLKVRYRVDGILKEVDAPPVRSTAAVISRVKIMAKLNIAERRLPQDGRIPIRMQGKELDLRVSTVPTMFGESVVMRLLDKESVRFDLDALGFDGSARERLRGILEKPYGILLVTGPTGSGKSTTLYTALSRMNTEERKIITVEDPVEYQLPGINQIQVKSSIGMTFASALRAIVRQDPDVIMVGEMRDLETARIAVQSALTGHVVLSTLHTNDAASGVTRLLEMGVEDYLLTSTINGILAQRLVRRLCPSCPETYEARPELAARFASIGAAPSQVQLRRAVGCDECNGTGYRGRLVITEVLVMTDQIRKAVLSHATATEIRRIAVLEGMETMYLDGLRKALQGRTTIEEVLRVAEAGDAPTEY
ncbi:MAG: type II secretion system ATPase GspE [Thiocapsa sp.]|nr:type II secretion system ATPase GspE [Thiocapsa sp.]MCG6898288.1 type II secretion system ATPase GspE [Thiocapsa sp.]MCG6985082.1 type II secretion system ATPase GspE [Thiocapsa sp.]